ncbi:MAG: hypothetical protein QOI66_2184 [Myxococcales bacterium]|jgi:Ni/Co efflux regulator RcnB|nr:hypothetical protein [Myxococcales bacterium]
MNSRTAILFLSLSTAAAALVAGPAARADDGFRCESGRLVKVGDRTYDVQSKCGDPDQVVQRTEKRTVRHKVRRWVNGVWEEVTEEQEVDVLVDEWTYDMGPQRLIRRLFFENDRLFRVSTGNRGAPVR